MEYIHKIYIINLESRKDRWLKCLEEIKNNNIPNNKIIKFNALTGNLTKIDHNLFKPINKLNYNNLKYNNGAYGCKLSHLSILNENKYEKDKIILIFEDDFVLDDKFNDIFKNILNYLVILNLTSNTKLKDNTFKLKDEFKMCFLGYSYLKKSIYTPINNYIGYIKNAYGTQGYLINTNFINKCLSYCNNDKTEIDVCYTKIQNEIPIHCSNKIIIKQHAGFSDILNTNVDYKNLYKK